MKARLRKVVHDLGEKFWIIPALLVCGGIFAAVVLVRVDRSGDIPEWLLEDWLYNGGGTGARTLLGAVASSTIGVAGTVFSITIAALSLAAGQMGPRLLRNFTRDRGNQITLGVFLGTFAYSLVVLRTVRSEAEGAFVPHLSLSVAIALALIAVATLVYFVGHMSNRINVDTVIELVSEDVRNAIVRLATDKEQYEAPHDKIWLTATPIVDSRCGYLQHIDYEGLADWAAERRTAVRLLIRPGSYVFPGAPIALVDPHVDGADRAIYSATALGSRQAGADDIEFAVRQLVEVAVRALSPGINDPFTAITVLDRLGASLCEIAGLKLPTNVVVRDDKCILVVPSVDYDGLIDASFHMIRQNASGKPSVLIRMLHSFTSVASCENDPYRVLALRRHSGLVLSDAERDVPNKSDLDDIREAHHAFERMVSGGPKASLGIL